MCAFLHFSVSFILLHILSFSLARILSVLSLITFLKLFLKHVQFLNLHFSFLSFFLYKIYNIYWIWLFSVSSLFCFSFFVTLPFSVSIHFFSILFSSPYSFFSRMSILWKSMENLKYSQGFLLYLKKSKNSHGIFIRIWEIKKKILCLIILLLYCKQSANQINYTFKVYYKYTYILCLFMYNMYNHCPNKILNIEYSLV